MPGAVQWPGGKTVLYEVPPDVRELQLSPGGQVQASK